MIIICSMLGNLPLNNITLYNTMIIMCSRKVPQRGSRLTYDSKVYRAVCGWPGRDLAIVLSGVSRAGISQTQHPVASSFFRDCLEAVVSRVGHRAYREDVQVAMAYPGHLGKQMVEV